MYSIYRVDWVILCVISVERREGKGRKVCPPSHILFGQTHRMYCFKRYINY